MDEPVRIDPVSRARELIREADFLATSEEEPVGSRRCLQFINDTVAFVRAFEDRLPPKLVSEIGSSTWTYPRLGDDVENESSANAYWADEGEVMIDFRYPTFKRAAEILRAAEVRLACDVAPRDAIRPEVIRPVDVPLPVMEDARLRNTPQASEPAVGPGSDESTVPLSVASSGMAAGLETPVPAVKDTRPPNTPRLSELATRSDALNEQQVAALLNVKCATLQKWRMFRKGDSYRGPKFLKMGRAVRYMPADLLDYIKGKKSHDR